MKLAPGLLEAIVATPDEPAAYLVAADWLSAQGDPWGEFIAAQCRLEKENDPGFFLSLRKTSDALLAAHGKTWLGAKEVAVTWRWGFVERLAIKESFDLEAVLDSDVGSLARQLDLWGGPESLRVCLELLRQRAPARLEGLSLTGKGHVKSALPPVRRLESHGLGLEWKSLTASLRELLLADVRDPTLSPFLDSGALTSLERLELLDVELPLGTTQRLIAAQTNLHTLHVEDDLPDDLAKWLAESPTMRTLDHLAIGGPATDVGLDAMLRHFARFSRLKTLILYGGRFGATFKKLAYKQLPQLRFEARRPAGEWMSTRR